MDQTARALIEYNRQLVDDRYRISVELRLASTAQTLLMGLVKECLDNKRPPPWYLRDKAKEATALSAFWADRFMAIEQEISEFSEEVRNAVPT